MAVRDQRVPDEPVRAEPARDQLGTRTDPVAAHPERLVVIFDDPPARPLRLTWRLGLGVLVAAAAVGSGLWWMTGGGHQVATRPAAVARVAGPVRAPSVLAVQVRAPVTVVAGRPARFVVSYSDGQGIFSGGVEDWGDTGVGSVSLAACDASPPAAAALRASYVATHTWAKAASYPVSFAVTTYTCSKGRAVEETRSARLTVVVAAR
jgi:hypothetical protein